MLNNRYKKNKTSLQQLYGRPIVTRTLCNEVKVGTKIEINPQTAKQNLQNLKKLLSNNPIRLKSLRGLNTDICNALGIDNNNASKYGDFIADGFKCSIRVSNHNSNAHTYDINLNNNISLKIRPHPNSNSFIPSENVTLEEFTYFDTMINQDSELVLDIIDSLIEYLSTGEYIDKSGLAKKNYSPDLQTISHQRVQQTLQRKDNEDYINLTHMGESKRYKKNQNNCNRNMKTNNRNVVRLTESQLKQIIAESVKRVLKESSNEFEFGKPINIGKTGKAGDRDRRLIRRQKIFLNRSEVGALVTIEGLPEEVYYIADADYIPEYTNYIDERPERIWKLPDFKKFTNYDEALKYAIDNFDAIQGLLAL